MKRGAVIVCMQFGVALAGCSAPSERASRATSEEALFARSDALWAVWDGVAEVPVCWLPPSVAPGHFVVPQFGPDPGVIEERKAWVREVVESEWNARTPLKFVGWDDCDATSAANGVVQIDPMDSSRVACPGTVTGQSCADALGRGIAGKTVHINVLFGDEFVYKSRLLASGDHDPSHSFLRWIPGDCFADFREGWWLGASDPAHQRDIDDPDVYAEVIATYRSCLQGNVAHEFGHVAGFAHEQYRPDNPALQAACFDYEKQQGFTDDIANVDPAFMGDTPLGTFDTESIMSYCRKEKGPRLTDQDVLWAWGVYR